jgi:hypothetical protein
MNKAVVYVGVDVSKAYLDVAWAERSRRFANNKSGLSALLKWIQQSPVHLICEASGGYERGLLDAAEQNGIRLSLVQVIGCGNMPVQLAFWLRPIRSMRVCCVLLAAPCNQSQHCRCRFNKSSYANWKRSADITAVCLWQSKIAWHS